MPISSSVSNSGSVTGFGLRALFDPVQPGHDAAPDADRVELVDGEVVGQTRYAGMHFGAAQRFVVGFLAGGHLHQRGTGQEHLRAFLDHHHVVGHPGYVGATRGGVAEYQRDGGDAGRRQPGQVAEHLPAGDENLLLGGQVGAAGFHQRDHRQPVLEGNLVGPQYFSQGPRVTGAALDRRVVGDDQAFHAADRADADDCAGTDLEGTAVRRQRAQLEKRGVRVDEQLDAFPGSQLAAGVVTVDVLGPAAPERFGEFGVDLVEPCRRRGRRLDVGGRFRVERGLQHRHD